MEFDISAMLTIKMIATFQMVMKFEHLSEEKIPLEEKAVAS